MLIDFSILLRVLMFMRIQELEGVEFHCLSVSRLSDIFLMRLPVASVVFVSGASQR